MALSLRETQLAMQKLLNQESSIQDVSFITGSSSLPAAQRVAIYQSSITANLIQTLELTYPMCEKLVGETFFQGLAGEYVKSHPAAHTELNLYGEGFPQFIENFLPEATAPYLPDFARLEWACHRAYFGPEPQSLDFEKLASIYPEYGDRLRFYLPENSTLLHSPYPIGHIWEVNKYDKDEQVHLDEGEVCLLVWRPQDTVVIESLTYADYVLLKYLDEGACLEELADLDLKTDINTALPRFVENGWLTDFEVKDA